MPPKLSELASLGSGAIKRITNEGLLFAVVLFVIATIAAIVLLRQPSIPWWAQATVAVLLLATVLFIACCLAHPFLPGAKPSLSLSSFSLGTLRDQLELSLHGKSDSEYATLLANLGIPPFPDDRDTEQKKINYVIENYPASKLMPRRWDLAKAFGFSASGLLLLPLWSWYSGLPSAQENVIRQYYEGINQGIHGDANGWGKTWEALSRNRQTIQQKTHPGNYPENYATVYDATHTVRAIRFKRDLPGGMVVYTVFYETREIVPPNKLSRWFRPQTSGPVDTFYSQFPDSASLTKSVLSDLEQYYSMESSREEFHNLDQADLRSKITDYVRLTRKIEQVCHPHFIKHLALTFGLVRVSLPDRWHPESGMRHYDALWVHDIVLLMEDGTWKIDKFVPQASAFNEVNPE